MNYILAAPNFEHMIDFDSLKTGFSNLSVLIVGDVMLDRYLTGNIERMSPEAPVPIFDLGDEYARLGGAANVALNIAGMGATALISGVVGDDAHGRKMVELCQTHNIDATNLCVVKRCTTTKTRIIAGRRHILRVDNENTQGLNADESKTLLDGIEQTLDSRRIDVVILQDYNKGVLTKPNIERVIRLAKKYHCTVAVDPKKANFFAYRGVDLFKPNLKELETAFKKHVIADTNGLEACATELEKKLENECTLLTLADKGIFCKKGKDFYHGLTTVQRIVDVCGAGDAVIAISAMAYRLNHGPIALCFLGNLAGGIVCQHVGVMPCTINDLERALSGL